MKNILLNVLHDYLLIFPEERERQSMVLDYLQSHNNEEIVDWNNFEGHVVAGGFVYVKKENKFLALYHSDLKIFLYPGGILIVMIIIHYMQLEEKFMKKLDYKI